MSAENKTLSTKEILRGQLKLLFEKAEKRIEEKLKQEYSNATYQGIYAFDGDDFVYRYTLHCSCCPTEFDYGYISLELVLKDEENAS